MRRSKETGIVAPASADDLAVNLRLSPPGKRLLLVSGFKTIKDMWRFVGYIKVPMSMVQEMVGSTVIQENLEVVSPDGTSFFVIGFGGKGDLMFQRYEPVLQAAGYLTANVLEHEIIVHGQGAVPISACKGFLHNVRPPSGGAVGAGE